MKRYWILFCILFIYASEGPNSGATFGNELNGGDFSWTNTGNAVSSDNAYASVAHTFSATSNGLEATNFSFSAVSGTINGIVVEVETDRITGSGGDLVSGGVQLEKSSAGVGNRITFGDYWSTTEGYRTYGSSTELWGTTWSASDITSSGFGCNVVYESETSSTARVDHIRITVYYTVGGTKFRVFGSNNGIPTYERLN